MKFSPKDSAITISAARNGNFLAIAVKDNGQGIPKEEQGKLFQRFSQTSTRATEGERGSGLGLAIARKIVEMHGGTIRVESEPGVGSTFTFEIPIEKRKK